MLFKRAFCEIRFLQIGPENKEALISTNQDNLSTRIADNLTQKRYSIQGIKWVSLRVTTEALRSHVLFCFIPECLLRGILISKHLSSSFVDTRIFADLTQSNLVPFSTIFNCYFLQDQENTAFQF